MSFLRKKREAAECSGSLSGIYLTVDGLNQSLCGSFVDYNKVQIAVLHILNGKTGVRIILGGEAEAVKAPVLISLGIECTGGSALNTALNVSAVGLENSLNVLCGLAGVKGGVVRHNDDHLRCIVVGLGEINYLFSLLIDGKSGSGDIAFALTDRGANRIKIHIVDNELLANRVGIHLHDLHVNAVVIVAFLIFKGSKSSIGCNNDLVLGFVLGSRNDCGGSASLEVLVQHFIKLTVFLDLCKEGVQRSEKLGVALLNGVSILLIGQLNIYDLYGFFVCSAGSERKNGNEHDRRQCESYDFLHNDNIPFR